MPIHHAARFLDGAIRSIRAQTFADLELILVDDGSCEDSDHVPCDHAAADQCISVLRIPHAGVATVARYLAPPDSLPGQDAWCGQRY